ncbi:UDP-N-acetylmuramoyl-L-alanyl-D-glutamate--2,6-diaminopimelate ligase [Methylomonas sp. EFPC3]|uniref:UDP-N-acetylmuramoyl-L-alanyl-D-glutamate--2, 6-diaminopimelate ligase n=1 Tax=Methylomonas sp. EFPC3 TaxID=3021710 RepID=UPI0024175F23|nr:UDP-N-acetylmuramoyl-L-alanyl-D-glutamate--2,6-diaminopimelate ligase [Methylomonas sp. EFPC3]WFP49042.1 UDP-N-acetylmuramoyl-L-alanyl-D-glutamate--2,6-diaminopimelate ligase [Methylomonas sp. EFPC3]
MKLSELLNGLTDIATDAEITGLSLDSRCTRAGDVFIALNGSRQHGLAHAAQAVSRGAKAVVFEPQQSASHLQTPLAAPLFAVAGLADRLGEIAARFYGRPSAQLDVIGVTGTNGKTTCSQLLAQALPDCGVIGTLGWGEFGKLQPTANTTPDALDVQRILSELAAQGKRAVAMEVSSHGLQQGRVNAVQFKGAVFTNLSRDHLDYHGDMQSYLQAKLALFKTPGLKFAAINLDDASSAQVLDSIGRGVQVWTFSASGRTLPDCECVTAENAKFSAAGIEFDAVWRGKRLTATSGIVGSFNLENLLAVLCVLLAQGIGFETAVARLTSLTAIAGRMEKFGGHGKPTVFVDYAHSPDALEKVLKAIKGNSRLQLVFGCGGDRDKGKRPEMGRIAETWADQVIVTDDNPRSEAPAAIVADILAGCRSDKVTVINDRATAINTAIQQAAPDDCVLIAGKGHEDYQEIAGVKWPFSDSALVEKTLAEWRKP